MIQHLRFSSLAFGLLCLSLSAPAATLYLTTAAGQLLRVETTAPGTAVRSVPITGLQAGETLLGIDVRPATGQLMAIGSTNRLYRLDTATGAATVVADTPFATGTGGPGGFDFNPMPDRIRLVRTTGENLRLHPDTGAIAATDTVLAFAPGETASPAPRVTGAGYTNSFAGTLATTLYVLDSGRSALLRQGSLDSAPVSPNAGQLFSVGALGVMISDTNGFDISRFGTAYAALQPMAGGDSRLYTIDLATGVATMAGALPAGTVATGLAVLETTGPISQTCSLTGAPVVGGLVDAASYRLQISAGSLASLFLSGITGFGDGRSAGAADLLTGRFQTELGCIAVEVGGQRAPITYAGSGQINIQVPPTGMTGNTMVQVILNPGRANEIRGQSFMGMMMTAFAPGLFTFNGRLLAAQGPGFVLIGDPSVTPGARAIRGGEIVTLYGTGFGATNPGFGPGLLPDRMATITSPVSVFFGTTMVPAASILYAGIVPGQISGLYQFNVMVPTGLPAGDVPVQIEIGGIRSTMGPVLRVGP